MIPSLFTCKQSRSIKLFVWIILIVLLCTFKNSFSQTPPTSYACDFRNYPGNTCPVECTFTPIVGDDKTEKGCLCFNNLDDDGDGKADAADPSCATYFGLSFIGEGSDCSITPPGANTPFDLVGVPRCFRTKYSRYAIQSSGRRR